MKIVASNIGKRYNRDWIFKNVSVSVESCSTLAITGSNGSGKSTLLQVLSSLTVPSIGTVSFFSGMEKADDTETYKLISYVSPYQEIIEEMTLAEMLQFHQSFKQLSIKDSKPFAEYCGINKGQNKEIRHFSSGMKQRVKLGLALLSDTPLLFLDEPTSNLDEQGSKWYLSEINKLIGKKTIVVASNIPEEYAFAGQILKISDYQSA
ncbi:ABC transporter ATP-binding protein [Cytophaga aurantiaca]|uniref:ABC transporter ATP-binding protein n=1 Tax=Cytophaga aurantiaca TaxID=29530 RepID=UPI00037A116C|nr:ABC transporter ATP-binding protein [Cytophaga aurantiaca]